PIWHQFYWPVVALAGFGIVQAFINLIRPDWLRVMVLYRAITAAAWAVMLFLLIRAGNWVVLAGDGQQNEGLQRTGHILNQLTVYFVAACTAIAFYGLVRHLRRLLQLSKSGRVPAPVADTK